MSGPSLSLRVSSLVFLSLCWLLAADVALPCEDTLRSVGCYGCSAVRLSDPLEDKKCDVRRLFQMSAWPLDVTAEMEKL